MHSPRERMGLHKHLQHRHRHNFWLKETTFAEFWESTILRTQLALVLINLSSDNPVALIKVCFRLQPATTGWCALAMQVMVADLILVDPFPRGIEDL